MKKEKSPVLVVTCIFFLLIFIVVPPVLRKLVPKEVKRVQQNKKSIALLMCNKTDSINKYDASIKMRYENNVLISNIVTYSPIKEVQDDTSNISNDDNNSSEENTTDSTTTDESSENNVVANNTDNTTQEEKIELSTVEEFNLLNSIPNINLVSENGINTFTLDSKLKEENQDNELLDKYFNDDINIEQDYYESIGYTCSVIKN